MWDLDGSAVRKIDEWCIFLAVIRQDPLWQCRAMRFNDWNNTGSYFMELDLLTFAGFNRKVSNVNAESTWVLNVHEKLLGNDWLHDCIHFLVAPLLSGSKLYTRRHSCQGRICWRQSAREPAKGHYVKLITPTLCGLNPPPWNHFWNDFGVVWYAHPFEIIFPT